MREVDSIRKGNCLKIPRSTSIIEDFEAEGPVSSLITTSHDRPEFKKYEAFASHRLIEDFRRGVQGAFAVSTMLRDDKIKDSFDEGDTKAVVSRSEEEDFALHALLNILRQIDRRLLDVLKMISEDLDDDIPYAGTSCKDWLQNSIISTNKAMRQRSLASSTSINFML